MPACGLRLSDTVNQIEWQRNRLKWWNRCFAAKKQDKPKPPIAEEGDEPDTEPPEAPPVVLSAA